MLKKDYKITTTVNKEHYILLRGRLLSEGSSFSDWLTDTIADDIQFHRDIRKINGPKVPEVEVTSTPGDKGNIPFE